MGNSKSATERKIRAEKYKTCKRICDEKKDLYFNSRYAVCSNKRKSYKSECFLTCEKHFYDDSINVKYIGRCWQPWKVPVENANYDWIDKI